MVDPCYMRETCKLRFTDFLSDNDDLILKDNVSKDVINDKKAELDEIRKRAPYDRCDICLTEVNSLFNKQLGLISSLQVYNSNEENISEISTISEDFMVKNILEPLSNKQRLQILKALAVETQSFSSLSKLTGLRGGNLLFHIQKLLESDLILQPYERGDYMIAKIGFEILTMLADFQRLSEQK